MNMRTYKKSDIIINDTESGFERNSEDYDDLLHATLGEWAAEEVGIKMIEDRGQPLDITDCISCCILDIPTDEGMFRIGYYSDNAVTIIDDCTGLNSCEEWANQYDEDEENIHGYQVPCYILDIS